MNPIRRTTRLVWKCASGRLACEHVAQPGSSAKGVLDAAKSPAAEHTRPTTRGFVIPSSFAIRHSSFCRGSALIAVFWMIAMLGMVMFAGAKALQADTQYTRMMRGRIFAKRYAEMGLEVARHPAIQQDDPLLHFSADDGGGYNVTLVSEEARLNVNHLAANRRQGAAAPFVHALGLQAGVCRRLVRCAEGLGGCG
jgi:hypothetical protein